MNEDTLDRDGPGWRQDPKQQHDALSRAPHEWRAALRRAGLPASALCVGLALVDEFLNRKDGRLFPSFEAIAEASCMSVRAVRSGVDALRKAGLISTKKTRFDGSLTYFLALSVHARSDGKLSVRENGEVTVLSRTKGHETVTRSDGFVSLNLRIEPENVTVERGTTSSSGPDGCAFGDPPSSDYPSFGRVPSSLGALPSTEDLFSMEEEQADNWLGDLDYVRWWIKENLADRSRLTEVMAQAAKKQLRREDLKRYSA